MTNAARHVFLGLLLALGLNHFVLGLLWLPTYSHVSPVALAFALYLLALLVSLYGTVKLRLPRAEAYLIFVIAVVLPSLVLAQLPVAHYNHSGSYQTWFVGAGSLVLAIMSARGYPVLGWIGTAALWLEVIAWGGPGLITTTGLIGALLMVLTAWAVGRGLRSTEAAATEYHRKATELQTRTAQNLARREAGQRMVESVLYGGLPLLERIREQGGSLSDADRTEAVLLESRFRDEIQGQNLLNDGVRLATREARKRGVEVSFVDEGGMDYLGEDESNAIRDSIVQALNATASGKIHIAAPAGESFRVSIVAQRTEANGPDLWLRLP
jgi:membrane protein implicated in regulation of membrane protease activity